MSQHPSTFAAFCRRATGFQPYPYQRRLADEGLPEVLRAPTGSGKTVAAVLPHIFRRREHPDTDVRARTPLRLMVALPLRTLVEQTVDSVRSWIGALGLSDEVGVHALMGGEGRIAGEWRYHPADEAIFVTTIDMALSRALNRGYGMGRERWPFDFGLFNNDTQWVFDEVQLMGAALPTSRQLQAFRQQMGTYGPTHSMWMSATLDVEWLRTVDAPAPDAPWELSPADLNDGRLAHRLRASREVRRLDVSDGDLAQAVRDLHQPSTRTIVMMNTVRRAQETYQALIKLNAPVVLVHSRFRPPDRARAVTAALADPPPEGTIVVTTQALEAGIDISSRALVTEAAPWPSIVQRAGRCNRYGEAGDAQLWWVEPDRPEPYDEQEVTNTVHALDRLEGRRMTGDELARVDVELIPPLHLVLRRKDLIELFDTAPDLSGNDVDVSSFIREVDDVDLRIAWRDVVMDPLPSRLPDDTGSPTRDELCPAPVGDVRALFDERERHKDTQPLWRFDYLEDAWVRCRRAEDVWAGAVLLTDRSFGRYSPERGWDRSLRKTRVAPITGDESDAATAVDQGAGDDRLSRLGVWVGLSDHLEHARQEAQQLVDEISHKLPPHIAAALVRAAALHDIGKAHEVFQDTMVRSAGEHERHLAREGGPWAKSSRAQRPRHRRKGFSHGLAGALALSSDTARPVLVDIAESDVVRYLVAAHHGRVRLGIRSLPDEGMCPGSGSTAICGVCDGDVLPGVTTPVGRLPDVTLDTTPALMGGDRSWTAMALRLRDRADLGIFRLGLLEALVCSADWRASRAEEDAG